MRLGRRHTYMCRISLPMPCPGGTPLPPQDYTTPPPPTACRQATLTRSQPTHMPLHSHSSEHTASPPACPHTATAVNTQPAHPHAPTQPQQ